MRVEGAVAPPAPRVGIPDNRGRKPMAREPYLAFLMIAFGSLAHRKTVTNISSMSTSRFTICFSKNSTLLSKNIVWLSREYILKCAGSDGSLSREGFQQLIYGNTKVCDLGDLDTSSFCSIPNHYMLLIYKIFPWTSTHFSLYEQSL